MAPVPIASHSAATLASSLLAAANASGHDIPEAPYSASRWLASPAA
jgi:hypothetical protein